MLNYTDLTIIKNDLGIPTALGYQINSLLLQHNKPLFVGGKGKSKSKNKSNGNDFDNLGIPAGLVCMTETICKPSVNSMDMDTDFNAHMPRYASNMDNSEVIPDGLYEKLLELAQEKKYQKNTRRNLNNKKNNKTTKKHKK